MDRSVSDRSVSDRSASDRSISDRPGERSGALAGDDASELHREIDRLRADLRQVRSDVSTLGADAARAVRAGMNDAARGAAARGKAVADATEARIVAHPFLAVAVAFVAGAVLGMRLSRKS